AKDLIRIDAVRFRVKVQKNAVAKDWDCQGRDVLIGHMKAVAGERPRLRRQNYELGGTNTGSVIDVFFDELRRHTAVVSCGANELDHVAGEGASNGHHADEFLEVEDLLGAGDNLHLGDVGGGGQVNHFHLFIRTEVLEHRIEHKSVQLRVGQRVGAFQRDRILGGQHKERQRQLIVVAADGARKLLHGLEQCSLGFRRCTVDLVG